MTRIKICGIKDKAHALAAVEAGVDFIGLVFAPSPRQISPTQARDIVKAVRDKDAGGRTKVVGVFVNMLAPEVNDIADYCALDWVQLSGDESWEYCREVARPIIKAIRVDQQSPDQLCAELSAGRNFVPAERVIPLLDSHVEGSYGGTGKTLNWDLAEQVTKRFSVVLAGGLNPQNVTRVVQRLSPWGVDVSSGVETDGVKDVAKIKAFVEAVRRADERK